jgi:S1/P1 Nuclease
MRALWISLSLAMLLASPAPRAQAWNEVGHMVVAKLAWDRLDEAAKKEAVRLLKRHPHHSEFLAQNKPAGVKDSDEWLFLRAATWPDWVRPPQSGEPSRPTQIIRFHRGDDHFVNMPFVAPGSEGAVHVPEDTDKNDILCAFRQRVGELVSKQTTDADKAVALSWILHLVGDVHQPLHCCTRYSAPNFLDGDMGGNLVAVQISGESVLLHTYWDGLLGALPGFEDTLPHQEKVYDLLTAAVDPLERDQKYGRDQLQQLKTKPSLETWAAESFAFAKEVAYRDGDRPLAGKRAPKDVMPPNPPPVGKDYDSKARDVARERVALAGYRLADKLNTLLHKPLVSPPEE